MTGWELAVVSALYLRFAWRAYGADDPGYALAFVAYALANVGFIWKLLR